MHHVVPVAELDRRGKLVEDVCDNGLAHLLGTAENLHQVATLAVIEDKVEVRGIAEEVLQRDNIVVLQIRDRVELALEMVDIPLVLQDRLGDHFHGDRLTRFVILAFVDY